MAELLNSAYSRVASVGVASKTFATVGIWPLNRNVFTAVDFVGSLLTDRPELSVLVPASVTDNADLSSCTASTTAADHGRLSASEYSDGGRPLPIGSLMAVLKVTWS